MMSSNKVFRLNKEKISRKRLILNYTNSIKFAEKLTTHVSMHQDCIKTVDGLLQ